MMLATFGEACTIELPSGAALRLVRAPDVLREQHGPCLLSPVPERVPPSAHGTWRSLREGGLGPLRGLLT